MGNFLTTLKNTWIFWEILIFFENFLNWLWTKAFYFTNNINIWILSIYCYELHNTKKRSVLLQKFPVLNSLNAFLKTIQNFFVLNQSILFWKNSIWILSIYCCELSSNKKKLFFWLLEIPLLENQNGVLNRFWNCFSWDHFLFFHPMLFRKLAIVKADRRWKVRNWQVELFHFTSLFLREYNFASGNISFSYFLNFFIPKFQWLVQFWRERTIKPRHRLALSLYWLLNFLFKILHSIAIQQMSAITHGYSSVGNIFASGCWKWIC